MISIIALLIAILLPVLGSARKSARMTKELSASKMLSVANRMYIDENKAELFPTWLINPPFRVQNNHGDIIYDPVTGIGPTGAGSQTGYAWRLAPYFDYQIEDALLVNEQAGILDFYDGSDTGKIINYNYVTSTAPSLGMNFYMGQEEHPLTNPFGDLLTEVQVRQPSNMLVAASARSTNFAEYPDGHRYVAQPSVSTYSDEITASSSFGFFDLRWGGSAVVAFLDGHSALMGQDEILDEDGMWTGRP